MTTEEIEKTVEQEIAKIYAPHHPIYTGDYHLPHTWVGDKTLDYCSVRDVAIESARRLVSQAYDEAIKAVCPWCHAEWTPEKKFSEATPYWTHHTGWPGSAKYEYCPASNIRTLRDSLAAKTSSAYSTSEAVTE